MVVSELYCLSESCKMNKLYFRLYIEDILICVMNGNKEFFCYTFMLSYGCYEKNESVYNVKFSRNQI